MERTSGVDEQEVQTKRVALQDLYPEYGDPLPGSRLKVDDDVLWLGLFPARVLWGSENPGYFWGYSLHYFGDQAIEMDGAWVDDRAPVDPADLPAYPIWPSQDPPSEPPPPPEYKQQQQQQPQQPRDRGGKPGRGHDTAERRALQAVLSQLRPAERKKVRAYAQQVRPELFENASARNGEPESGA